MIITISGTIGSGKSTVSKLLSEELNCKLINIGNMARKLAEKENKTIIEFNDVIDNDDSIDNYIDNEIIKMSNTKENIIIDSRIAWFLIKSSYKILLFCDKKVASNRLFNSESNRLAEIEYTSERDALRDIEFRMDKEVKRFKNKYGIDYLDYNNYDLVIETTNLSEEDVKDIIIEELHNYNVGTIGYIDKMNILPTQGIKEYNSNIIDEYIKDGYDNIIECYTDGNKFFIKDGHHRFISDVIKGTSYIKIKILNEEFNLNYLTKGMLYDLEDIIIYKDFPEYYK